MSVLENSVYWLLTISPFVFAVVGEAIDDSKEYWQYLFLLFAIVSFLILITNFGRYFYSRKYGISGGPILKGAYKSLKEKSGFDAKEVPFFLKIIFFPGYLLRKIMLPGSFRFWMLSSLFMFFLFGFSVESTIRNTADRSISLSIPLAVASSSVLFIIFYALSFKWQI